MPTLLPKETLKRVEFSILRFHLCFEGEFELGWEQFCGLRRRFEALQSEDPGLFRELASMMFPESFTDPQMLRRHQRPASALVLRPFQEQFRLYGAGEIFVFEVLFLGRSIVQAPVFLQLLHRLGSQGLCPGRGRFRLTLLEGLDASGAPQELELPPAGATEMELPLSDAHWYLDQQSAQLREVELEFLTPARLMVQGKPLFRPCFGDIFPFMLRRMTSMIQAHCGLDLIGPPGPVLDQANRLVQETQLSWQDLRSIEFGSKRQDLGGLCGKIVLRGDELETLLPLLQLGSLLNLGKGASFGAGRYCLLG